jgi:hypothetical protein
MSTQIRLFVERLQNGQWTPVLKPKSRGLRNSTTEFSPVETPFPYEQWPEDAKCYSLNANYLSNSNIIQVSWVETYREFVNPEFLDYFFEQKC